MLWWVFVGAAAGAMIVLFWARILRSRIRQLEEQVERLEQEKHIVIRFIREMGKALGEDLSREKLFERIARAALGSTEALSACVYEWREPGQLVGVAIEGLFPPQKPLPETSRGKLATRARFLESVLRSEVIAPGEGVVGTVAQTRKGELIVDGRSDPRIVDHGDPALVVRSMIAVPIEFQDRLIGVLAVANPAHGGPFTETDFSLVTSLAEQAGLAVHHNEFLRLELEKRQMDLDMSVARSVQLMLVPTTLPEVPGLDIDLRYHPAKQVGGDLVDIISLADGRVGFVVADVSGKGPGAAILMAICRTHLRHALEHTCSPAEALKAVNHAMEGEVRDDMFITAALAIYDPARGRLAIARAGHEAPILVGQGDVSGGFIEVDGMALGMVDHVLFDEFIQERSIPFAPGNVLVLYTDGITE
ncbi:MAG: GAF domain-containing protein, partial [Verrucomicrobia bacterium]